MRIRVTNVQDAKDYAVYDWSIDTKSNQTRRDFMRTEQLEKDIFLITGDSYQSISTAFIRGDEVLLIDALASREDAEDLRDFIETELKKEVRFIILTHYMCDHLAALKSFPKAGIIAHQNYRRTFDSQRSISEEEADFFVEPTIIFSDKITMKWGRLTLDVFHNPSHTQSTVGIDVPEADLLLIGDAIFGNTVFLSSAGEPELFESSINNLRGRNRRRIIPGHIGIRDKTVFENAEFYLNALRTEAEKARQSSNGEKAILQIPIKNCLPDGIAASDFEEEFHRLNLKLIIERKLFL